MKDRSTVSGVNLSRMNKSFAGIAALYFFGIPLSIMSSIVLARTLTVAEFGRFGFAISIATIIAIPVAAGLPALVTRQVAAYAANGEWPSYRGLILYAHAWVILFTTIIGMATTLWALSPFGSVDETIIAGLGIVPFIGFTAVRTGALKGLKHPVMAEAPTQIAQPLLLIAGYMLLHHYGISSANNAIYWYISTGLILFIAATFLLLHAQPPAAARAATSNQELRHWLRALPPFAMIGAVAALNAQIAIVLLGVADLDEEVAFMRVAERGAHLVIFPLYFASSVLAPLIVELNQSRAKDKLRQVAKHASRISFSLSLPLAIFLVIFGHDIISYTFGARYSNSAFVPMVILVSAQTAAAALGASSLLLAMSQNEKWALFGQLVGLFTLVLVALALIGKFGAIGASIGAAAGLLSNRIVDFIAVRIKLGFWPGIL